MKSKVHHMLTKIRFLCFDNIINHKIKEIIILQLYMAHTHYVTTDIFSYRAQYYVRQLFLLER